VFGFLARCVGDRRIAEDLLQETFLRVFASRQAYRPLAPFRAWLYTITRHLVVDQRRRAQPSAAPIENSLHDVADPQASALERHAVGHPGQPVRRRMRLAELEHFLAGRDQGGIGHQEGQSERQPHSERRRQPGRQPPADGEQPLPEHRPDKIFFPRAGHTKLDLVRYYAAVAEGALRGIAGRPIVLKRYVDGAEQEAFFQKRAPAQRPEWVETVELRFPSGRTAREVVVRDAAQLLWIVNLGCIDLNPHPVRADDLEHPDELRVDLDPGPGVSWDDVRRVALLVRDVLEEYGLRGWPKTSGSRGMHVNVRIQRRWGFDQVRRAALALARDVERRAPEHASSKWWKEERRGVFLDYNQNAKDRTVASAWSVRPTPDARVSMPLEWEEVTSCDPAAFTLATAPARFAERGDASAGIDAAAGSLDTLLELSGAQEAAGLRDAPWPPHYRKQRDEPPRVAPSRRKAAGAKERGRGRRRSTQPLITVAKAQHEGDALAGLERWKVRHPAAAARLQADDILVDSMRGRSTTWTRVRINLRHVPEGERPAEEPPTPDYDPWRGSGLRPRGSRALKTRSSS
jgi:DNA ligase D-like protein (predicted polymerase)